MKKVLLTGVNSYIGTNLKRYLQEYNLQQGGEYYIVKCISQRNPAWEQEDFSGYDTIVDVTGLAYTDVNRLSEDIRQKYYDINWRLAVKTARKARDEGVKQFIYLSSSLVYGDSAGPGREKHITGETYPAPTGIYGESKWQAEQELRTLETESFKMAVLRLPFVYGAGCRGNYRQLSEIAGRTPIFPSVTNSRSMIYIENLNAFLRLVIEEGRGGLFFPQNAQYSSTAELVQIIGREKGRCVRLWGILNPLVWLGTHFPGKIGRLTNKAFGSLTYDMELSKNPAGYQLYNLQESVRLTEQKGKM